MLDDIPVVEDGRWIEYRDHHNHLIKRVFESNNNMAKISIPSKFVKANVNVKEKDIATIKSAGEEIPTIDKKSKQWVFDLELMSGELKQAKFNKQTIINLVQGFGTDETSNWIDKQIVCEKIIHYQLGDGIVWNVVK